MKAKFLSFSAFCAGAAMISSLILTNCTNESAQIKSIAGKQDTNVTISVADGFASGTTGGAGGTSVNVSTAAAFKTEAESGGKKIITVSGNLNVGQVKVASDKTITGANSSATITGNLSLSGVSNIIIQNLNITNPAGIGTGDGIEISNKCSKVFVTHCSFTDCADGSLDMKRQSDYLTVSWCRFRYVNQTEHNLANMISHDDAFTDDRGYLHITMHHNWYDNGCQDRMPRVRFGQVHCYNNYYAAAGASNCVAIGVECQILLENCYFDKQKRPWKMQSSGSNAGKIHWNSSNVFVSSTVPTVAPNSTVFNPSYSYNMDSGNDIKNKVLAGAGNK